MESSNGPDRWETRNGIETMPQPATTQRTQEQRREQSERRMLKAAITLFARQGYQRTTLGQVGREAGYTAGLVSHKFGSKEGLLLAVVRRIAKRFLDDQLGSAIEEASATDSINNFIRLYLREASLREGRMRALYVIMGEALGGVPEIRKPIADLNASTRNTLARIIQRGIDDGEFQETVNPDAAAALIIGALRGMVMQHLIDPKRVDLSAMRAAMQATAIAGLR